MELSLTPSEPPPGTPRPHLTVVAPGSAPRRDEIDPETLDLAKAGDRAALEQFVRHYQARVFAFLARSCAGDSHVEDLAQEVFLRAIRALSDFTPDRAKVSTWLFQIGVRLLQDRRKRPQRKLVPVSEDIHDGRLGPEESLAQRRILERIEIAARKLPEEQRVALVLFEFHDLSHEEIAEATGVATGTVKTRVFRARKFLKQALKDAQEQGS